MDTGESRKVMKSGFAYDETGSNLSVDAWGREREKEYGIDKYKSLET